MCGVSTIITDKNKMKAKLFFLLVFSVFVNFTFAQLQNGESDKSNQLYVITKNDGTEYIGIILSDDGREVLIETDKLGKIYIPKADIKSMIKVNSETGEIVNGELKSDGPFTTRYSFTTNALPIKKGEDYALVNWYGPEVHFAMSNRFSLGVMSTWIGSPFVVAAKYSFKTSNEKINFSIGTLMGTSGYIRSFKGYGGLHFGNVTFGTRQKNLTFSAGYAYVQTGKEYLNAEGTVFTNTQYYQSTAVKGPATKGPICSVAGLVKIGPRASFVFDSMFGSFSRTVSTMTYTKLTDAYSDGFSWYPETGSMTTIWKKEVTNALFIMPGMRFQKNDRKAFQVCLAGVSIFSENRRPVSFPLPMFQWFFKF